MIYFISLLKSLNPNLMPSYWNKGCTQEEPSEKNLKKLNTEYVIFYHYYG